MDKLHNNHNVYILGAGFSAERGLPLVSNFMFEMRDAYDWLQTNRRIKEAKSIEKVLEFRQNAAASAYRVRIDLENIEELFSLSSAENGFPHSQTLSEDIRVAIAATIDYCGSKKNEREYQVRNREPLSFLQSFISQSSTTREFIYENIPAYQYYMREMLGMGGSMEGENTIVSFNYDTVVEEALSSMGMAFSYGFKAKSVNYRNSDLQLNNHKLKLLKLHGSVNWGRRKAAGQGEGKLTVFDSYEAARSNSAIPDLIPPTWRKIFDGNLGGVWDNALEAIRSATRIFIIGFSVPATDNHFKYLLAAGLQRNISLRDIVLVNPDASGELRNRINNLFTPLQSAKIQFISGSTETFVRDHARRFNRGFPHTHIQVC